MKRAITTVASTALAAGSVAAGSAVLSAMIRFVYYPVRF